MFGRVGGEGAAGGYTSRQTGKVDGRYICMYNVFQVKVLVSKSIKSSKVGAATKRQRTEKEKTRPDEKYVPAQGNRDR